MEVAEHKEGGADSGEQKDEKVKHERAAALARWWGDVCLEPGLVRSAGWFGARAGDIRGRILGGRLMIR